jgi:hypothetical protein
MQSVDLLAPQYSAIRQRYDRASSDQALFVDRRIEFGRFPSIGDRVPHSVVSPRRQGHRSLRQVVISAQLTEFLLILLAAILIWRLVQQRPGNMAAEIATDAVESTDDIYLGGRADDIGVVEESPADFNLMHRF